MNRTRTAVSGVAWLMTSQAMRMGLQIASTLVLARLLTPEDFGVFAMLTPVVAMASLIQDLGLAQAMVQRESLSKEQSDTLFWINFGVGCAVALLLVVASPLASSFFNEPRLGAMVAAWSAVILISSVSFGQYAMLSRAFKFRRLAIIEMSSGILAFATAVALAWIRPSPWVLWWSSFVGGVSWSLLIFVACGWRPSMPKRGVKLDGMFRFGLYVFANNVALYASRNLDNVLIGRSFGSAALGYYDRAYKLRRYPPENLGNPIGRVIVPMLSRLQGDGPAFRRAFLKSGGMLCLACAPPTVAAMTCADDLIRILLGETWMPVSNIFFWLGFGGMALPILDVGHWVLLAQGRSRELMTVNLIGSVMNVVGFVIGLRWGAVGVAISYSAVECLVRTPLTVIMAGRGGAVTVSDFFAVVLPVSIAAALSFALRPLIPLHGLPLLFVMMPLCYGMSALAYSAFPSGRLILHSALKAALHLCGSFSIAWPFSKAAG